MTSDTTVTVTRDRWGIGHADGPNADAAFWAQGWLAASDRIWQMEWDRRRAQGRWAEIAGPSVVHEDAFFRRLDLASIARSQWAALDDRTRAMTASYSRGVNAWLRQHGDELPPEFDYHPEPPVPWEPWHCLAVYKVRHLFMGTFHRKLWRGAVILHGGPDVARAMLGDPGSDSAIVPGSDEVAIDLLADAEQLLTTMAAELAAIPDVDGASNSWAVHGTRTASGKPLLAGDPHRGIEFPNVYYQCHLRCPDFDAIGLAFPGVPGFPHFGHNAEVAWCITHGMADDTDIFVERALVSVDRTETIEVGGSEAVVVECATTERGPVVLGQLGTGAPVLSMMWTGFHGADTTFDCLRPMLEAGSVAELEAAVEQWVIPVNNLLSADRAGTISFQLRGRLVERSVASRWSPVTGDSDHSWAGREPVPFDQLQHWTNPERGYLVTANNRTSDDGPFISLDFAVPARHDRIVELLAGLEEATVEDMTAIHADTCSLVAPAIVARFLDGQPITEAGRAAQRLLLGWDHDLAPTSVAATVYATTRRLWSDEVGRRLGLLDVSVAEQGWPPPATASRMLYEGATTLLRTDGWRHVPGLDDEADLRPVLGALLDRAAAELADHLGPDPGAWTWQQVHRMVSPHPLATARPELGHLHPRQDSVPGDGDTIRCASLVPASGEQAATSSVARYVFDLGDWDRSGWVVPHGVSGVPGSGHELDQRRSWLDCDLVVMAYSSQALASVATKVETLSIVTKPMVD